VKAAFELRVPCDAMATLTITATVGELSIIEGWIGADERGAAKRPYPVDAMMRAVRDAVQQAQKAFVGIQPRSPE
jgi:hypothetical protein